MTTLLSVQDLAVARGGLRTLEGVSFALAEGQAIILRGPNGLGKTTLLRTLAGLQPVAAGQVVHDPSALAYAGHADGLKSALSVTENLRFWAGVFGRTEVGPAIERMNLSNLAARPAHMLSAGQKRRLGLARLLVTGRKVWLLDEPTVSLDTQSVALFAGVLRDLLGGGGAALIATHIDLGLPEGRILDLTPYRADPARKAPRGDGPIGFNEAFA